MGYLVWFGIVALVFALLHYFTELSGKQKGIISLVVTLIITAAIMYNVSMDRDRAKVSEVELKYQQGETLVCRGIEVNNSTFGYSVGTQSFVGNRGSKHYQQIINARECQ
ncbi:MULTISPECIES: hypothetical protein [unclassified Sulfuricurvum]|uniref:hypothetical protein n=1 Tax=unclassified Sulfuricurvum TaxID=2632390 RepID=UPI00029975B4|nr:MULTISPECIES: hypothetical protein [unclassified Sulfuricurvum]AFV97922.1 hypothetical protein B649_08050 [Candidatus Sulfuricurvum sp. RIFRC-1]OHD87576.1 MAG: hypothetical protein A2W83_05415 [Sulfuricurvum sp. RIFCSPLOWO2_12_43_5]OHD89206.1 MAG: hypothetical protein A3G19_07045 [Sulfuricurvum sp. RIFCSPLOWO2_12_FULL_43_24]HBM35533.1 hypothetical protein [Sulfuricurvum sp.]